MASVQRTLFVGDVHGCLDELKQLLKKLAASTADRVIFVGDLVAKGPDSQGVVAMVRELGASSVLGNHDDAVLRYRRAQQSGEEARIKPGHLAVARSLQEADWLWLEHLPLYLRVPEHEVAVVHAGVVPGKALEAQARDDLLAMRTLRSDGSASPRLEDGDLWAAHYKGPEHVVFGHNAISGLQRTSYASGLDTGCVYGRALTALVLPENTLVSVAARRAYKEIGP
ncbi:MAG: metallophosphoesterase [Myxococcales bacterium]